MAVLRRLMVVWKAEGSRVLMFSSSCELLDIIETAMIGEGTLYERLDGTTGAAARQERVEKFNNSPTIFMFLISTTAGGVGLNLTGANVVVIFDPSWNPGELTPGLFLSLPTPCFVSCCIILQRCLIAVI